MSAAAKKKKKKRSGMGDMEREKSKRTEGRERREGSSFRWFPCVEEQS